MLIKACSRFIRTQALDSRQNLNVKVLDVLDLMTVRLNGVRRSFTKRQDRKEARALVEAKVPMWAVGTPPCTPFSIRNFAMDYPKMDVERVRQHVAEGHVRLNFVASLYRHQVAHGKYDVHEHPTTAWSWKEDVTNSLARDPFAHLVIGHECRYGLVKPSAADRKEMPTGAQAPQVLHEPENYGRSAQQET